MKAKHVEPDEPHPLEGAVLAAFKASPVHDRVTLARALGGITNAYISIAEDVLANMLARGKLWKDDEGEYRLRTGGMSVAEECHARRNCRSGLVGLSATLDDGHTLPILSTFWEEHGRLVLKLDGRGWVSAERCRLASKWPARCCRPIKARLLAATRRHSE
jgi:hypothetical protein